MKDSQLFYKFYPLIIGCSTFDKYKKLIKCYCEV